MSEQTAVQAAEDDFAAVLAEVSDETPDAPAEVQDVGTSDETADVSEQPDAPAEPDALTDAETAAAKLIESGDLDGGLKRLGLDPALVKVDRRQFFAMRKGLSDAKAKERAGEKAHADAKNLKSEAEKLYGPIAAGFRAMRAGDGAKLRAAIELLAEDGWDQIKAVVEAGNKPLDPATAEVMRLRAELAQRDEAGRKQQAVEGAKRAEAAQIAKLEAQV